MFNEWTISNSPDWCSDTPWSGMLHPGQRCYRSVPCSKKQFPSGDQLCFDDNGNVISSPDIISPVEGRNADGSCNFSVDRSIAHAIVDVDEVWIAIGLIAVAAIIIRG